MDAELIERELKKTGLDISILRVASKDEYMQGLKEEAPDVILSDYLQWPVAEMVYQHHERCDGSGYPRGLKGDEILLGARILAVADVVEAMSSHRPYRPALEVETALEEVESGGGTLYDPEVCDACLRLFRDKGYVLETAT